jgi:imidazolonepropionase-like amidohydrolase
MFVHPFDVYLRSALLAMLALVDDGPVATRVASDGHTIAGPTYAYVDGRWLIDGRFVRRTRWSMNGLLTDSVPPRVDSTIHLNGGWAVPPFADAHTHNLDGTFNLDSVRALYVREGTFYVQVLTNSRTGADRVRAGWNRPCELDVAYANGGVTSTLSHPFLAYEPRAMGFYTDWASHAAEIRASRKAENDSYFFIDSLPDLDRKWPVILAGRPDVLKIFLLDASEHPPAMPDTGLPSGHGLRPSLVLEIVRRAHAAGLRVAAHIETANDFRIALNAGVDMFAHLPGYEMAAGADSSLYLIDDATARLAGARGIVATPTLSLAVIFDGPVVDRIVQTRRNLQIYNIKLLKRYGVNIVVGSDWFGRTASDEYRTLASTGIWSPAQLLHVWSEETSRAIFPRRRIGRLSQGWEASFLVLSADPTRSFQLPDITLRVKQGCLIRP